MTYASISIWNETERALPLDLAVSSLFSANRKYSKDEVKDVVILSKSGCNITYTGPSLGTDDMDVLMALSHLARGAKSSGDTLEVVTSFAELLAALEWPTQRHYYDKLDDCLVRLSRAHLNLKAFGGPTGKRVVKHIFGTLLGVTQVLESGDGRERTISTPISRSMLQMWQELVLVSWTQRKLLKRNLSRWLQSYVLFGDANEREYLIDDLMVMSKFEGDRPEFRRRLKEACDELVHVNFLSSYSVTRINARMVSGEANKSITFLTGNTRKGAAAKRAELASPLQLCLGD